MRNVGLAIIFMLIHAGCAVTKPDLRALYKVESHVSMDSPKGGGIQPPVIVIPGIVSSTLIDENDKEIWFGPWHKLLTSQYKEAALEIDEKTLLPKPSRIRASTLPDKVLFFDFYGSLFSTLENYGDYAFSKPGVAYTGSGRRYYKFAYDWRYDNTHNAKLLDEFIDQIRRDYSDPTLEVDLIGHSMGGLLARYYMRYGGADVLDDNEFPVTQAGAKKVRRLIQLGAPNLGSAAVLHQLIEGYKVLFTTVPVEVMVTMPSVYQLLPHPLNRWLVTNEGKTLDRDLFDVEVWRRFQWGIFDPEVVERIISQYETREEGERRVALLQRYFHKHLERARRFVWSLTVPVPDLDYDIVAFGGNCSLTPARLLVEEIDGESHVRLWPKEVKNKIKGIDYDLLMLEPGDGRVTKPSMLARELLDPTKPRHHYSFFPLNHSFFLCHSHGQLAGNINFQDNLLNALLEPN